SAIVENFHYNQKVVNNLGLNSQSAWDFLDNNQIGSDFADPNDPNDLIAKHINYDTICHFMGIEKNRYYIGRKSTRREYKKISEFIKSQDSILMRLQLRAVVSKGFRYFYNQKYNNANPYDTLFKSYLNIYDIRTRPIDRVRPYYEQEGWDNYYNSPIDSGFY